MTRRKKIAYALSKALDSVSWEHRVVVEEGDGETIYADLNADAGLCNCCRLTFSIADEDVLLSCSPPHLTVKEVYRGVVAEYFTYVNYYLRWGRWILSPEGDVLFRYRKDEESFATDAVRALTDLVATAQAIIEYALPGVYMIVTGMWTSRQAIDAYRDAILKKTAQATTGLCLRPSDYTTNDAKGI